MNFTFEGEVLLQEQSSPSGKRCPQWRSTGIWMPLCRLLIFLLTVKGAVGHGRLLEPPSRSSMWRFGFKNPPNYNDHELFCGGLTQMALHGCGICGDALDAPQPRPNEVGGKYANGIVVRRYKVNQIVDTEVELTAHHKGYFQFKICPTNNAKVDPTQDCFDEHVLKLADGSGDKYYVPEMAPDGKYYPKFALPKWMSCSFCVVQWTYTAGNNWGRCNNGTEGLGCGHQETFRACADVSIGDKGNDLETNEIPGSVAPLVTTAAANIVVAMFFLALNNALMSVSAAVNLD